LVRSGLATPYGAPHNTSASAPINASMNIVNMPRNRSGDALASWSCRNRAGSILVFAVILFAPRRSPADLRSDGQSPHPARLYGKEPDETAGNHVDEHRLGDAGAVVDLTRMKSSESSLSSQALSAPTSAPQNRSLCASSDARSSALLTVFI
jgi:hypothetical protein